MSGVPQAAQDRLPKFFYSCQAKGPLEPRSDSSTTSSRHHGDSGLLQMLTKLNLRQEDMLNQMIFHLAIDDFGIKGLAPDKIGNWCHLSSTSNISPKNDRGDYSEVK